MIKHNSRQLLLVLSHPDIINQGIPESVFQHLYAELSASGQRSLLTQLVATDLIWNERRTTGRYIGATELGKQTIQSLFPALQATPPLNWHLMTFTKPTRSDPQFRSLAHLLRKELWFRLTRGVYVHPFGQSPQLQVTTQTLYNGHIAICTVNDWQTGFSRTAMVRFYTLESLSDLYSSISKEAHRLLGDIHSKNELNNESYLHIQSLFIRFEASLQSDVGLLPHIFSGSVSAVMAYDALNQVILAISERIQHER